MLKKSQLSIMGTPLTITSAIDRLRDIGRLHGYDTPVVVPDIAPRQYRDAKFIPVLTLHLAAPGIYTEGEGFAITGDGIVPAPTAGTRVAVVDWLG